MRIGRRIVPILPYKVKLTTLVERLFGKYASVS